MNHWTIIGWILIVIAILASAGIYTLFPAAPVVFVVLGTAGGYLIAKKRRG